MPLERRDLSKARPFQRPICLERLVPHRCGSGKTPCRRNPAAFSRPVETGPALRLHPGRNRSSARVIPEFAEGLHYVAFLPAAAHPLKGCIQRNAGFFRVRAMPEDDHFALFEGQGDLALWCRMLFLRFGDLTGRCGRHEKIPGGFRGLYQCLRFLESPLGVAREETAAYCVDPCPGMWKQGCRSFGNEGEN